MKKINLLFCLVFLFACPALAQTDALHRFIEEHKSDKSFTFAYLSKDLFEVVSASDIADKDWKKLHNVVKNIGSLSILAADSITNGTSLYKETLRLMPTDEFDVLLTVQDGPTNVRIWSRDEEEAITDLVMLVGAPEEFVLICFAGQLELGNISELARLLDADEVDHLARATETVALDFRISPNPNNGKFNLSATDAKDPLLSLSITDQNGRLISSLNLSGDPVQQVTLPDLPSGLYWLQVKSQSGKIGVKQLHIAGK
ncbi:MAG: DUF4252 domain-containing protein [Lewinellaceae bacterium]|nr:DUF4252 domain-containing protein [Lewinellaceae bacterium]